MKSPAELWSMIKQHSKREWKIAFLSAFLLGLLIHMPMMVRDIPNHDGLDSLYFDQNMITSGRWFLTVACGISSYFTLPWMIGLLAVLYLALSSVVLVEFLEIRKTLHIVLISGLLLSFPAIASTFAYVFTMDGYMLALFLAVLSVLLAKKYKLGWLAGAVCLACSMGTYQAYLPFAVLLSIYGVVMIAMGEDTLKGKLCRSLRYLYMGVTGVAGYYGILKILLKLQGKELASYQGISSMGEVERAGLWDILVRVYTDFGGFTLKGNVLVNNGFSLIAVCGLVLLTAVILLGQIFRNKWWKSVWLYVILVLLFIGLPIGTNIILFVSPEVTYHVLMRYQWVLYPILMIAFIEGSGEEHQNESWKEWGVLLTAGILIWNFAVTDNIAYSNLQKRYEKTYAYCVRLLDRIEQTPGYYQGIPIAMIGVVGDESYPATDITQDVTSNLIGMNGDVLLYTGNNYELFIRNYLGATLNILPTEAMEEIYYSQEYREMDSFPGENSVKLIDGIIYVKTENVDNTITAE